jgi:flagellar FliJ protein
MPEFNFRLQGYLNLKSKMEDQRKLEYERAASDLERERAKLAALENQRAETLAAFKAAINKGVKPQSAGFYNSFLNWLKESADVQADSVRQSEVEADSRRIALAEAMKERKMLEILKEKQYADYLREQKAAEQKAADELISFRRGSGEGRYGG